MGYLQARYSHLFECNSNELGPLVLGAEGVLENPDILAEALYHRLSSIEEQPRDWSFSEHGCY